MAPAEPMMAPCKNTSWRSGGTPVKSRLMASAAASAARTPRTPMRNHRKTRINQPFDFGAAVCLVTAAGLLAPSILQKGVGVKARGVDCRCDANVSPDLIADAPHFVDRVMSSSLPYPPASYEFSDPLLLEGVRQTNLGQGNRLPLCGGLIRL